MTARAVRDPALALQPALTPYVIDPGLMPPPSDHHRAAILDGLRTFNPFSVGDAAFIARLREFDASVFALRDLVAPAWVFYDCGLVPGIVLGYFIADASDEPSPQSLMVALPTATEGIHLVHTLEASPNLGVAAADALWHMTWQLGLACMSARAVLFTEAWNTRAMARIATLGPARVFSAWTPIHDIPTTALVGVDPTYSDRADLAIAPTGYVNDDKGFREIQARIDDGWTCWYLGRGSQGHAFHLAQTSPPTFVGHALAPEAP